MCRVGLRVVVAVLGFVVLTQAQTNGTSWFSPPDPQVYWYAQTFDHFNSSDTRQFQQRYLVYDDYWTEAPADALKPIFFCPGGEADVYGGYEHNGFMFQFGMKLGAFMLFPEHRFYGDSLPFGPKDSYTPENIVGLTIEQALQDYVTIIDHAMQLWDIPANTPIIAMGGSYPGELASFLRIAFPNVVDGALASSAPVRYHPFLEGGTRSGSFFAVATRDFAQEDPACPGLVRDAFSEMIDLFSTASGRQQIQEDLKLCTPLVGSDKELRLLNLWIENAFASLGMENYPYSIPPYPAYPMRVACDAMRNTSSQGLLPGLAASIGVWYNATQNLTCHDILEEYYPCADITGCGGGVGDPDAMSWDYQSCTELIANVDTNNVTDMFPPAPYDFDQLTAYCQQHWGATPDPLKIPTMYNYTSSSRIIYSNGYLDPWWPGGVLTDQSVNLIALQMEGAAHHLDLRGSDPADPVSVVATRQLEEEIILGWLYEIAEEREW